MLIKYNITFYCPDRHIRYDGGRSPDTKGVGGGVTVRIRLAHALAKRGHSVSMICNCVREEVDRGVHYIPLNRATEINTDILILATSGDGLTLEPFLQLKTQAKLKLLLAHGTDQPGAINKISFDSFYAISNFIRQVMRDDWGVPTNKIFVSYHGVIKEDFRLDPNWLSSWFAIQRDVFRLAYLGHPHKGRDAAFGTLKLLQTINPKYHLHVFGDERLWGGKAKGIFGMRGVKNFGLVNQKRLAQKLLTCNFGIFLQARLEPFGMTMIEAMTAGCIPIASPVGAYREIIQHGKNGFLVEGDYNSPDTWKKVSDLICELQNDVTHLEQIREYAKNWVLDWQDVVQTWEGHWNILLGNAQTADFQVTDSCNECASKMVRLEDGLHCFYCGNFIRHI